MTPLQAEEVDQTIARGGVVLLLSEADAVALVSLLEQGLMYGEPDSALCQAGEELIHVTASSLLHLGRFGVTPSN